MRITDIFKKQQRTFSFEFFPPRNFDSAVRFGINSGQLMKLNPSFVTVTYGAGGGTQERTFDLVNLFQNQLDFTCMAHYTCVNAVKEKIAYDMRILQDMGIENVMLLRGDPPKNETHIDPNPDGFDHASDLIRFVRENYNFDIGAGAYPEGHVEAPNMDEDLINLRIKVDSGADFLVTQMFFDNKYYWDFMDRAEKVGIKCRIIPGIIPINNYRQIKNFAKISGATIPQQIIKRMEPYKNSPNEVYKIGLELAINQARDLLDNGAPGIHIYTLNKSRAAIEMYECLSKDYKEIKSNFEKSCSPHLPASAY
ncbi:MAG: methylenetetrahydrofolate reductase [NAD(P)H] [Bacteroidales bacterium]|nr:methylenetetrahydrofolate reductase [NAD(P)H] [Bacteroidales bacterium]